MMKPLEQSHVVVIGAGLSGLAATRELALRNTLIPFWLHWSRQASGAFALSAAPIARSGSIGQHFAYGGHFTQFGDIVEAD